MTASSDILVVAAITTKMNIPRLQVGRKRLRGGVAAPVKRGEVSLSKYPFLPPECQSKAKLPTMGNPSWEDFGPLVG
jgi:hypothetical protein